MAANLHLWKMGICYIDKLFRYLGLHFPISALIYYFIDLLFDASGADGNVPPDVRVLDSKPRRPPHFPPCKKDPNQIPRQQRSWRQGVAFGHRLGSIDTW